MNLQRNSGSLVVGVAAADCCGRSAYGLGARRELEASDGGGRRPRGGCLLVPIAQLQEPALTVGLSCGLSEAGGGTVWRSR